MNVSQFGFCVALCILAPGIVGANTVADIDSGLVGYWSFDEGSGITAHDSSGNDNHGTIYGATWTDGISGSALSFDGIDDYVLCLYPGPLGNSPRTLTLWAKTLSTDWSYVFTYGFAETYGASYRSGFDIECPGVHHNASGGAATSSATVADNNWHFYVFVLPDIENATVADMVVYQDTLPLSDYCWSIRTYVVYNTGPDNPINIGRFFYAPYPGYYSGILDEIRLHNRALTDSEVKGLYYDYATVPALVCSLWAEPDTVSVGQDIHLYMMVENAGEGIADSVVPAISMFGDGHVTLDSGPIPPYANLEPGVDTTYHWVFTAEGPHWVSWQGEASGFSHFLGREVNSSEDTSNILWIQTPAQLQVMVIVAGADTVRWGDEDIAVDVVVHNSGEADARVDTTSLRFVQGSVCVDNEYSVILLDPIDKLAGLGTDMLHHSVDVSWEATEGWVTVHSRIFGSDKYSGELLSDTTAALPDSFYVLAYQCGDRNGDARVTVADATYVVSYIYRDGPVPLGDADVNVDQRVTIADATYLVGFIYRGGPEPCNP